MWGTSSSLFLAHCASYAASFHPELLKHFGQDVSEPFAVHWLKFSDSKCSPTASAVKPLILAVSFAIASHYSGLSTNTTNVRCGGGAPPTLSSTPAIQAGFGEASASNYLGDIIKTTCKQE